ncbi:MAG: OsmC family protein [Bacteroidota bacterium]
MEATKNPNGVDMQSVGGYVEAVKENNNNAKVSFVAESTWKGGTKAEVNVKEFFADGNPASRPDRHFKFNVTEPSQLGGADDAPNPVELLAAALCGCLTAGIATNSAMFGTELEKLDVKVKVDFDLMGVLGLDRNISNGAQHLHYTVTLKGKAAKEALQKTKETLDRKSAILNTLKNPLNVTTEFIIEE